MHCYKIDLWDLTILIAFYGTGKKILTHNGCKKKTKYPSSTLSYSPQVGHGEEAHSPGVAHVVTLVVGVFAIDRPFATFPPCPVQKRNDILVRIKCILSPGHNLIVIV
jgi:hypothetical protein